MELLKGKTLRELLDIGGKPLDIPTILALSIQVAELAVSGTGSGGFGNFSPVYVRGQAYLMAHRGAEAAAEFQRILDYPGILRSLQPFGRFAPNLRPADPVYAIARLQLARAFRMSGNTAKAKTAYRSFLALWKDADRDVPVFQQAQAEYAGLH